MAQLDVQYVRYSTDGSAARQFLPVYPKKQRTAIAKPHRQTRTRIYIDPVAILGIAVATCMLIMMVAGVFQFRAAQAQAESMESYVTSLQAENKALENTYVTGYDLDEVEKTALALGMVPEDSVKQVSISVTVPQPEENVTVLEHIGIFLAGLFA